jgi:hypothetical protein
VHDNSAEISKRWLIFPKKVTDIIADKKIDGYSLLEEEVAQALVEDILRQPPIENPINHEFLLNDLTHLIARRATVRKGRRTPAVK